MGRGTLGAYAGVRLTIIPEMTADAESAFVQSAFFGFLLEICAMTANTHSRAQEEMEHLLLEVGRYTELEFHRCRHSSMLLDNMFDLSFSP